MYQRVTAMTQPFLPKPRQSPLHSNCLHKKISLSAIKLPDLPEALKTNEVESFYRNDFVYENAQAKALANTDLYNSLQAAIGDKTSLPRYSAQGNALSTQKEEVMLSVQRIVSMVFILYGILNLLVVFFAVIVLSICNLEVVKYLLWMLLEFFLTSFFLLVFTKGYNAGELAVHLINSHIIMIIISLALSLCALVITQITKGIENSIRCANNLNNKELAYDEVVNAVKCIIIVFFFFSCIGTVSYTHLTLPTICSV
eukprot:TRINITY_DN10299_c0_g1_i12.p1 TRINITY_DN10299_c0_g1~~TRINITY_DN10299_c0_g1_i12.p1  ORF type:complete len:256 (-),score=38.29 TRINITY_DN10299_c0_g1_i12:46-813(-)